MAGLPPGAPGVTPPSGEGHGGSFVSDVLIEMGVVERDVVEHAVEEARGAGRSVEDVLVNAGAASDEAVARAVAERYGLDFVDLDRFDAEPVAVSLIDASAARRYRAVPIAFGAAGRLVVAFKDPVDPLAISDIEVTTKSEVQPVVSTAASIERLIERYSGPEPSAPEPALEEEAEAPPLSSQLHQLAVELEHLRLAADRVQSTLDDAAARVAQLEQQAEERDHETEGGEAQEPAETAGEAKKRSERMASLARRIFHGS